MAREKLTLIKITPGMGSQEDIISRKKVWADVHEVGVSIKYRAQMASRKAELQAVVWRREYDDQTHAEIRGVKYRIEEIGRADNDLHLKLILAKGG